MDYIFRDLQQLQLAVAVHPHVVPVSLKNKNAATNARSQNIVTVDVAARQPDTYAACSNGYVDDLPPRHAAQRKMPVRSHARRNAVTFPITREPRRQVKPMFPFPQRAQYKS